MPRSHAEERWAEERWAEERWAEEAWVSDFRDQGVSGDFGFAASGPELGAKSGAKSGPKSEPKPHSESQREESITVSAKGNQGPSERGQQGNASPENRKFRSVELCQEADSQPFQIEVEQGRHRSLGGEFRLKIRNRSDRNLNVVVAMRVLDAAGREQIPLQSTKAAKPSKQGEQLHMTMKLGRAFQRMPNGYYAVEFTGLGLGLGLSLGADETEEITARSRVYLQVEDGEARFVDYGEWYFGSGHDSHGQVVKE